jgi:hypothetical protein
LIVHEAVMESAIGQWQPLTGFEPVPSDGKPVSSDGERVSSDGEPVASDGEPVGMTAWRR